MTTSPKCHGDQWAHLPHGTGLRLFPRFWARVPFVQAEAHLRNGSGVGHRAFCRSHHE
jgi:hypothetical protein